MTNAVRGMLRSRGAWFALAAALLLVASPCSADWSQVIEGSAADNGFGLPVDARANFSFNTGTGVLSVILENLQANPKAVNQALSGLYLTITTGQTSGTLNSSAGTERTIASNGTYSDGSAVATGWALLDNVVDPVFGTTGLQLNLLGTPTAPKHTIIGPPDGSNVYSNANNSITGNNAHNPFLGLLATYELSIPGLNDSSRIASATFQFNTSPGTYVGVPEPSSLALVGIGLGGLVLGLRRRKTRTA